MEANKLKEFIDTSKARLRSLLEQMKWTEEEVMQQESAHCSLIQHVNEEPSFPESYAARNSVKLQLAELRTLVRDEKVEVPTRFSELQLNFTRAQKLSIYEHIVERTGKCTEPELQVPVLDGQLSFAEIMAVQKRERKHKRRYRVSKPTQIEELRALVDLQMQAMKQFVSAKQQTACRSPSERHRVLKKERTEDRRERTRSRLRSRSHRRSRSHSRSRNHRRSSTHHRSRSPHSSRNHSSRQDHHSKRHDAYSSDRQKTRAHKHKNKKHHHCRRSRSNER